MKTDRVCLLMIVASLIAACGQAPVTPQVRATTGRPRAATATATSGSPNLPIVIATVPTRRPAPPTATAHVEPLTVSIVSPASRATVQGVVQVSASTNKEVAHVEFYVDGRLRSDDKAAPYVFTWDAFHERYGTHPSGVHTLRAVAYSAAGDSAKSDDLPVWVIPAPAGDCNSDGLVDENDLAAIDAEVGDGDGGNTEDTPRGAYAGNPACDANEDNLVDDGDYACAQLIISQGPNACLDTGTALVEPLIFVPKDLASSVNQDVIDFVKYKIEEARRFYARANNGKTFRALPLEVVYAERNHAKYWVDGNNYEYGVLQELQARGYPVNVDWAQMPSNRVTWVLAMGSGGWAGSRHYQTGGGFAMWGDALLFAAMDLNCNRVVDGIAGQGIADICRKQWLPSGQIYGFGIGGAIHELGHTFNLPHPPDGDPAWQTSIMGGHWNYPNWSAPANGLSDADRAILAGSHFFPGFSDTSFPTATISSPRDGAGVSGVVTVSASASDNDGVSSLSLTVDGTPVSPTPTWFADPAQVGFNYAWDTTGVEAGLHTLELTVTDTAGNVSTFSVDVNVQH